MDILNEVKVIEEAKNTALLEAGVSKKNKKIVEDRYRKKAVAATKIATQLHATNGTINWDASDDAKEARNKIVAAFMSNDPDTVISMMTTGKDPHVVVEVLKALVIAHNGYVNLLKKATKAGKLKFVEKVYSALGSQGVIIKYDKDGKVDKNFYKFKGIPGIPMDDNTDDKDSEKK